MSKLFEHFKNLEVNPGKAKKMFYQGKELKKIEPQYDTFSKNLTKKEIISTVKSVKDALGSDDEELKAQLQTILKIMEPYVEVKSDKIVETNEYIINSSSLFTFLLDLFIIPDKVEAVKYIVNPDLGYETQLLLSKFTGPIKRIECAKYPAASYCSLIVTENADLHTAADLISTAWKSNTLPWVIRDILVQENVQNRFTSLIEDRLSKLEAEDVAENGPLAAYLKKVNLEDFTKKNYSVLDEKIVTGIQRNYLTDAIICAPIVTLNVFRTVKEATTLYNKINGGSVSIWSENITEALELGKNLKAKNVFINTFETFDARCPLTFGAKLYGSELFHFADLPGGVKNIPKAKSAKSIEPLEKSFFSDNFFYNVVAEKKTEQISEAIDGYEKISKLLNFDYKTIVTRFGQTFSN